MTRPAGVTASAVVAIIGSVVTLVFAGLMFVAAYVPEAQMPPNNRGLVTWAGAAFVVLAALGIWTAVGLFRMRSWARTSILVFAGIMAAISLMTGVMMSIVPLPPLPNSSPGAETKFRLVMVVIYLVPLLIGVWWLVYFNRQSTREAFASTATPGEPSRRPLSISIIGWWNIVGGAICVIPAAMKMPAFIAGFILTGWSATLIYVVFAALGLYLGWGLLKLDERARLLTIAWWALSALHTAYIMLVPGPRERMLEFQKTVQIASTPPQPALDMTVFMTFISLFTVAVVALAIWFLVRNKSVFLAAHAIEHQ